MAILLYKKEKTSYALFFLVCLATAASAPPYPYPQFQAQSAFYPGSQYPTGTAPPPYTAGTQPAYMPATQMNQSIQGTRHAQSTGIATNDPAYPPDPSPQQMYNGYGTGLTGNGNQT